jgi:hypothetical protein
LFDNLIGNREILRVEFLKKGKKIKNLAVVDIGEGEIGLKTVFNSLILQRNNIIYNFIR